MVGWDLDRTKKRFGSLMRKASARSPLSIPFLQYFLTIGEKIMNVLKGNRCQKTSGEEGFIVAVRIFDDAA